MSKLASPHVLYCQSVYGMKGGEACIVAWWMVGNKTRFWAALSPWAALGENRAARQQATLYFPARRIQILISISCSPRILASWPSLLFIHYLFIPLNFDREVRLALDPQVTQSWKKAQMHRKLTYFSSVF
jgi:hypothetical protein